MNKKKMSNHGFTLVELLVAMVISLLVIGAISLTFKSQQDSYIIQEQVSAMQQNIRGAMYMLTRDIQMAGYYTNFVPGNYTMNWDDLDGDNEVIRPLIYARNNVDDSGSGGGDGIRDGTDVIVIVKASDNFGVLGASDSASGSLITLNTLGVGAGAGQIDIDDNTKRFGLMVKSDLSRSDFFEISSGSGGPPFAITQVLGDSYGEGDMIFRADVIIYRVDENAARPCLVRRNLGNDTAGGTYQMIAENIDDLQFRYLLNNGSWVDDPAVGGNEPNVRAVDVSLVARTAKEIRGYTDPGAGDKYRRRTLNSIVKTRNIGL